MRVGTKRQRQREKGSLCKEGRSLSPTVEMMDGIEFQYRPLHNPTAAPRYPLTFDQRLTRGDRYREAAEELNASLQSIEAFYCSPAAPTHTGSRDCERCAKKKRRIMDAYYDYYLGNQPGRWDENLVSYRHELEGMFNSPGDVPLEAIHERFKAELREHLRKDLCAIVTGDRKEIVEHKMRIDDLLSRIPIQEVLAIAMGAKVHGLAFPPGLDGRGGVDGTRDIAHPAGFNVSLQKARTAGQRAELYVAYYCTPAWNDTPLLRNMKMKYGKLFEAGMSHDTALGMWRKEAQDVKRREVDRMKQRLGELQMAQSAHLKNKKRKMEKDARMKDKEYVVVPRLVGCSLPGCEQQIDASKEGPIECAVCDWLAKKSEDKSRFYYCSEEHVEVDFDEHDRHEHACIMGDHCYFYPMVGPPGETGACGICPDCVDNDVVSFFCSQDCYAHNIHAHRDEVHYDRGIESNEDQLDVFRPEHDLDIITS